jgi:UDP-N-acetylmuramyl pentapeptide synthase
VARADVRASSLVMDASGSLLPERRFGCGGAAALLGDFNVANAVAAAATALALEVPLDQIVARLAVAPQVPGRMERLTDDPA